MSIQSTRRANSFFVYLIFGLLIVVFIISFGPQSINTGAGCRGSTNVAKIEGQAISESTWRYAYTIAREDESMRMEVAMLRLIRRQLLASMAKTRGYRIGDAAVDQSIKEGRIFLGGQLAYDAYAMVAAQGEYFFDYKALKAQTQQFGGLSLYRTEQMQELLAALADTEQRVAFVAPDEAKGWFAASDTHVSFEFVRFASAEYGSGLQLTPADLARFSATHETEIKARYERDKSAYTGTGAALKLRMIRVDKGSDAAAAKTKLETARAQVLAKQKTFAELAATLSSEVLDRNRQGSLGWVTVAGADIGDAAANAAIANLVPDNVSEVIDGSSAYYLLLAEAKREGDLSLEQVRDELAEGLAREIWGQEAARKAALDVAGQVAAGKQLADLFEKDDEPMMGRGPAAASFVPPLPTATPQDPMRVVTETLPAVASVAKPKLRSYYQAFRTAAGIENFGESRALAKALFDELAPESTSPRVYAAGNDFVLVRLISRNLPEDKEFEAQREQLIEQLARSRGTEQVSEVLKTACEQAVKSGELTIREGFFPETTADGRPRPAFSPCLGL